MIWFNVIFISMIVCTCFLWATALSGSKFYELTMSRKDIKSIKWFIHLAFLVIIFGYSYFFYKGYDDVQKMESQQKIEEVQAGSSETER